MCALLSGGCIVCGGVYGHEVAYPAPDTNELGLKTIRICSSCGFGQALPALRQEELDRFYASGHYWHQAGNSPAQRAHEHNQARLRLDKCLPHLSAQRPIAVADIGAGHGAISDWLVHCLGGAVSRYDFIEPDDLTAQAIAARRTPFTTARLDSPAALAQDYDLIFLNHVLEHVADPCDFLSQAIRHLGTNGIIYVETPNSDYRFKEDVFPHTQFLTGPAFARLAVKLDVEMIECEEFGAWPGSASGIASTAYRVFAGALYWSAKIRLEPVTRVLDGLIWRYAATRNGIWLRWIARKRG